MMGEFHFIRPAWLAALIPLGLLLFRAWKKRRRNRGNWERACDPDLLPFLLSGENTPGSQAQWGTLAFAGLLAIAALAGPTWEKLEQPVFNRGSALIIALDLSNSMNATDTSPSRLVRARHKLLDILSRRKEGQTALLVYTNQSFVVTPLTDDTDTIASLVPSLDTAIMPAQGTDTGAMIAQADRLFSQAGISDGHLLLITDSSDGAPAAGGPDIPHNIRLSVLAVGTTEGAPIPQGDGGFLKDDTGQIVIPGLNLAALSELAATGKGRFARLAPDDGDIDYLLAGIEGSPLGQEEEHSEFTAEQWQDQGPWLVLLLLPLAVLAFRRGYLMLFMVLLAPFPGDSYAFGWRDLWSRPDQQASQSLETGDPAGAAQRFTDPEWKAAAYYQAGDYEQSLRALEKLDNARASYNRGNALARLGKLEEAITAYDAALAKQPDNKDAEINRDLVRKLLEQQQQSSSTNDQQGGKQEQQEKQSPGEKQDPSDGEETPDADSDANSAEEQEQRQQDMSNSQDEVQSGSAPADSTGQEESAQSETSPDEEPREQAEETVGQADNEDPGQLPEQEDATRMSAADQVEPTEEDKAVEQWLRQIPDDPGGLLRRKFRYQYQRQYNGRKEQQNW